MFAFLKNTYLYRLRKKSTLLFALVIAFIGVTLFTNFSGNEITPFFTWSMYSSKVDPADSFPVLLVEYNNDKTFNAPHTWHDHKRMMVNYTLVRYAQFMDNGKEDPDKQKAKNILERLHIPSGITDRLFSSAAEMDAYPYWLKTYLQTDINEPIDSLKIYRKWLKYNESEHVTEVNSELIINDRS